MPTDWGSLHHVAGLAHEQYQSAASEPLQVQFLGAGGVFIHMGDQSLLADPFFSNPSLSQWLLLRTLKPREDVIDASLPALDQLKGIVVGHGHFDHALDLAYIAHKLPESVKLYGSDSVRNMLASALSAERMVGLNSHMADNGAGGEWVYITPRLRILPIRSEHSPHVGSMVFASDSITAPQTRMPQDVLGWKCGTALSYVIDFLQAGPTDTSPQQVSYRLFFQSSGADVPAGVPPQWLLQEGTPIDMALLAAANYNKLQQYPEALLGILQPKSVMIIHWEKFWDDYSTAVTAPLPGLDFAQLEAKIRSAVPASVPVWVPNRGSIIELGKQP